MAREYREYEISVPAGTAKTAPATTTLTMPARIVREIRARIPPGPKGLMGFQLAAAGVQVIPWNAGGWIVADDETFTWQPAGFITSGAWQVIAYNTGANAHTIYLVLALDPPQTVGVGPVVSPVDFGTVVGGGGGLPPIGLPPPIEPPPIEPPPIEPPPIEPPPVEPPPPMSGYDAAKRNALAAVETALGAPLTVTPVPRPAPGSLDAAAYDAVKQAAIATLAAL